MLLKDLPKLTGGRMERLMAIVKNAPKDPSCGCIKLGETAMMLIRAIVDEQRSVDIEMEMKNGSSENADKEG